MRKPLEVRLDLIAQTLPVDAEFKFLNRMCTMRNWRGNDRPPVAARICARARERARLRTDNLRKSTHFQTTIYTSHPLEITAATLCLQNPSPGLEAGGRVEDCQKRLTSSKKEL